MQEAIGRLRQLDDLPTQPTECAFHREENNGVRMMPDPFHPTWDERQCMKRKKAICYKCGKDLKATVPINAEEVTCFKCYEEDAVND